jgi:hypothetical protein
VRSNLALGHDLRAGLLDPSPAQLDALRQIICHLLARDCRDVIACRVGWTDAERQRRVGESGRHEPHAVHAIVEAELGRTLQEPDPLRGIAALVARCAGASALDPEGVTRTSVLGSDRMSRKLHDALPGGDEPLRGAVWEFLRPKLSPRPGRPAPRCLRCRRCRGQRRRSRHTPRRLEPRRPRSWLRRAAVGRSRVAASLTTTRSGAQRAGRRDGDPLGLMRCPTCRRATAKPEKVRRPSKGGFLDDLDTLTLGGQGRVLTVMRLVCFVHIDSNEHERRVGGWTSRAAAASLTSLSG